MFHRNSILLSLAGAALVAALVAYAFTVAFRSAESALNRAANPDARLIGYCSGVLHYEDEESDFPATGCTRIEANPAAR